MSTYIGTEVPRYLFWNGDRGAREGRGVEEK